MAKFTEWLQERLDERGWTQADLSRNSGLSSATVSRIMNEERSPNPVSCTAIAKALSMPEMFVMVAAGLLPKVPEGDNLLEELIYNYHKLEEDERKDLVYFSKVLRERESYYKSLENRKGEDDG